MFSIFPSAPLVTLVEPAPSTSSASSSSSVEGKAVEIPVTRHISSLVRFTVPKDIRSFSAVANRRLASRYVKTVRVGRRRVFRRVTSKDLVSMEDFAQAAMEDDIEVAISEASESDSDTD